MVNKIFVEKYAIIYVLIHHSIFRLYIYFLNIVLYFSSIPVLTFFIDVVFILSIKKALISQHVSKCHRSIPFVLEV